MNRLGRNLLRIALALGMLACIVLAVPQRTCAQDTYQHFTVVISDAVPCSITIDGGGVSGIYTAGTTVVSGSGPFYVYDLHGTRYLIDQKIGCIHGLLAAEYCCVNVCYSVDGSGMPVITVTPGNTCLHD